MEADSTFATNATSEDVDVTQTFVPEWLSPEDTAAVSFPFDRLARGEDGAEDALRAIMAEMGFIIVTDVIPPSELAELEASFVRDLNAAIPPSGAAFAKARKDPLQYRNLEQTPIPGHMNTSFLTSLGFSHSELSFRCRLHPNVRRVFAELYPDEPGEQVVGLDNLFFTPKGTPLNEANRLWPHADINRWVPGSGHWTCMQGIVYIWSSCPDETSRTKATTVLQPRSHLASYDSLVADESFRHAKKHFCAIKRVTNEEKRARLMADFCREARRIPVPAGALLIWSSRTIHQGWVDGPRLAQPVCWEPRARRDHGGLVRKAKMALAGIPSTHWASVAILHSLAKQDFFPSPVQDGGWRWLTPYGRAPEAGKVSRGEMEALMAAAEKEKDESGPKTRALLALLRQEVARVL